MDFPGYYRWFHANRESLKAIIQALAKKQGLRCDEDKLLGNVQIWLIWLGLDSDYTPPLWLWVSLTFRMIHAELDVLWFNRWWEKEEGHLAACVNAMMSGYHTQQDSDDLLQDAYVQMNLRIKNIRLDRVDFSTVHDFVMRAIRNLFISYYRKGKRQQSLPEEFDIADPLAPSALDRVSGAEQAQGFRRRLETLWRKIALTQREKRALCFWVKSDFDRRIALQLMGIAGDDTKTASQYDQPLFRAKRKISAALSGIGPVADELDLADAIGEWKMFLMSKLGHSRDSITS